MRTLKKILEELILIRKLLEKINENYKKISYPVIEPTRRYGYTNTKRQQI